jgi:hypothetical protein
MVTWGNRFFNLNAVDVIVMTLAAWLHTLARIIEYIYHFG